jgi:hypothetical protein
VTRPTKSRLTTSRKSTWRRPAHQTILAEGDALDLLRQRVLGGETEIGRTRSDGARDLAALALLDVDGNARMRGEKGGERLRQIFRDARRVGEQVHAGARAAGEGGEIAAQRVDVMQDDAGMIEQALAGRSRLHAAAAALEQHDPQRRLQSLDPLAGGGQRQMHPGGARGDAAGLRHRDEQLQIDQIETHETAPSPHGEEREARLEP